MLQLKRNEYMEDKIIDESKQGASLTIEAKPNNSRKLYIESYGCQMNFSDSDHDEHGDRKSVVFIVMKESR